VMPWMHTTWTEGLGVQTQRKVEMTEEFAEKIIAPLSVEAVAS
jgi:hypothetical protein